LYLGVVNASTVVVIFAANTSTMVSYFIYFKTLTFYLLNNSCHIYNWHQLSVNVPSEFYFSDDWCYLFWCCSMVLYVYGSNQQFPQVYFCFMSSTSNITESSKHIQIWDILFLWICCLVHYSRYVVVLGSMLT